MKGGSTMEWKPYLNYKDVMRFGLSESTAYKALEKAMSLTVKENGETKAWCETMEAELVNNKVGKRAPTELVIKVLPHAKKFFSKKQKEKDVNLD